MASNSVLSLDNDMVSDILAKLPVKSLLRFNSLSKYWLSFITNPVFINIHYQQSSKNPSFIFSDNESKKISILKYIEHITFDDPVYVPPSIFFSPAIMRTYFLSPRRTSSVHDIILKGSCGGLLCIQVISFGVAEYAFWNPATRNFKYVEYPQHCMETNCDGFGYNSKINDYKLVRIGNLYHLPRPATDLSSFVDLFGKKVDDVVRALVFSWRTGSWRLVEDSALQCDYGYAEKAVSVKGELYWLHLHDVILAFDTAKDKFRRIDLSYSMNQYSNSKSHYEIKKFNDSLALFVFPDYQYRSRIDLWVMNENNKGGGNRESWTKLFTIEASSTLEAFSIIGHGKPVWAWRDKIIAENFDRERGLLLFLLYDPVTEKVIEIPVPYGEYDIAYDYVESLVTADGTNMPNLAIR